ncbi:hypothetical protein Tco_1467290 [Tanacetum coccineum]
MRAEYNIKEKRKLRSVVDEQTELLKVKDEEIENLKAQLLLKEANLDAQVAAVHELETSSAGLQEKVTAYEDCMGKLEEFHDERMRVVDDKFDKLYADFLVIVKCLRSPEYLSTLGVAISKAIEKGMQDGLAAGITHGQEDGDRIAEGSAGARCSSSSLSSSSSQNLISASSSSDDSLSSLSPPSVG